MERLCIQCLPAKLTTKQNKSELVYPLERPQQSSLLFIVEPSWSSHYKIKQNIYLLRAGGPDPTSKGLFLPLEGAVFVSSTRRSQPREKLEVNSRLGVVGRSTLRTIVPIKSCFCSCWTVPCVCVLFGGSECSPSGWEQGRRTAMP